MRKTAVLSLALVYLLVLLRPVMPHVFFSLDRHHIETALCEQRAVSGNHCKGACFMRKNLQQQQHGGPQLVLPALVEMEVVQLIPVPAAGPSLPAASHSQPALAHSHGMADQCVLDRLSPPPQCSDHLLA